MALPLAKNSPVPMAPPMAIMLSCREPMPRSSWRDSGGVIRFFFLVLAGDPQVEWGLSLP